MNPVCRVGLRQTGGQYRNRSTWQTRKAKAKTARMTIGRDSVDIPAAAWNNLYDPTLETCRVFSDTRTGYIYVDLQSNRSAAGGYEVVWVFKDGRFVKRYVDQSEN